MQQNGQIQIPLRKVLLINGVASGAVGLILIFFSPFVANITGLSYPAIIFEVGIGLLLYVAFLFWAASRKSVPAFTILLFAIIDFLWVIDSILLLEMNGSGYTKNPRNATWKSRYFPRLVSRGFLFLKIVLNMVASFNYRLFCSSCNT